MKNNILSLLLLSFVMLAGCKNNNDPISPNAPPSETVQLDVEPFASAKPEDDNKSSGVYKGTFIGSSGTYKLTIQADGIKGVIVVDGKGYNLTTNDISTSNLEDSISNAVFSDPTGTVSLTFSVDADGENPTVTLVILGHSNIMTVVMKETSTSQVKIFEGYSYAAYPEHGTQCIRQLNLILGANQIAPVTSRYYVTQDIGVDTTNFECDYEGWVNDYQYSIAGSSIDIFREVLEDPSDPTSLVQDPLFGGSLSYTDYEIDGKDEWTYSGITYTDSLRIKRKL